jgi:hypothetical protein
MRTSFEADAHSLRAARLSVAMLTALTMACGTQGVIKEKRQDSALTFRVHDITVMPDESSMIVQYFTATALEDCKAQATEMLSVWQLAVKPTLDTKGIKRVFLVPEDKSSRSLSFEFVRRKSGAWSAQAPCDVEIAVDVQ